MRDNPSTGINAEPIFKGETSLGVGVDIEEISRFKEIGLEKDIFFNKIFTKEEIEYCKSKKNPYSHLAARFAGKEAVIKAFGGMELDINCKQIEIVKNKNGSPKISLLDKFFSELFEVKISMSHTDTLAIAFAIVIFREKI